MRDDEYRLITKYPVKRYRCGLKAGDRVRLKKDILVRDHEGKPTGKVYPCGGIWTILPGAKEKPLVVWLLQSDGMRHTWDDDKTIFETFEIVKS